MLRFVLELGALGALAYWGFHVGDAHIVHWILGIGAPAAAAYLWGSFVAPKARYKVSPLMRLTIEFIVFAAATLALYFSDQEALAITFAAAAVISRTLKTVWKQ